MSKDGEKNTPSEVLLDWIKKKTMDVKRQWRNLSLGLKKIL